MTGSSRRRLAGAIAGALITLAASSSWAADVCAHPLEGGECFKVFSLVTITYMSFAATYAVGALGILKPRLDARRWLIATLGAVPFSYLATMTGFTLGGAAGWLSFPLDASPFFFIDWFVVAFTLVAQTLYVVGAVRWATPGEEGAGGEPELA